MKTYHRIKLWRVNSWLIDCGESRIVVDTGRPHMVKNFIDGIAGVGYDPRDVSLIVITHAHYDHTGGACELKRISGAPVAIHASDAETLRTGGFVISDGLTALGSIKTFLGRHIAPRKLFAYTPVEPDIIIKDEFDLRKFGLAGKIIHTPGHSDGSISILTDDGDLFAGDLTLKQPLPGIWHYAPIYGTSIETIRETWRRMIALGAKHVYPSHGIDFPIDELTPFL